VLHGPPGGGKGTLARIYTGVLGLGNNVISLGIEQLGRQEYLHACLGKSLVIMPDERPADLTNAREGANNIKKIAGGDAVSCRALFNDPVTNVQLYCRFLMLVNEMPNLADEALVRRMVVVDFTRVADRPDLGLDEALAGQQERLGQLLWMLMGRLWLKIDGRFVQPDSSRAPLDVYEQEADKYGEFVETCLEITGDPAHRVRAAEIAEVYAAFAQAEHGHTKFPAVGRVMAGVVPAIRRRWPQSQHQVSKVQPRKGATRHWAYEGMRLLKTVSDFAPPDTVNGPRREGDPLL
jgi:phage/plasmid-associated DNA primase